MRHPVMKSWELDSSNITLGETLGKVSMPFSGASILLVCDIGECCYVLVLLAFIITRFG